MLVVVQHLARLAAQVCIARERGVFNIERCYIYQQLTHLHYCWNEVPGGKQRQGGYMSLQLNRSLFTELPPLLPLQKKPKLQFKAWRNWHFLWLTKLAHTSVSNTDPPTPLAAKAFQNRHMFLGKNNHKNDCLYLHTSIGVKVITLWFLWAVCLLVWQHEEEEREQEIRKEIG